MKIKLFILLHLLVVLVIGVEAQVVDPAVEANLKVVKADSLMGWKTGGVTSLTFGQIALVNWSAGGENSIAANGLLSLFANYKGPLNTWDNSLDLGYGFLKLDSYNNGVMKTDDRINLVSLYGRKAFKKFYYAGLLDLRSQFAAGYNYPNDSVKISNFLAPGYLILAAGLSYKPNDYFTAFFAPVSGRFTFVMDQFLSDQGAFGVDPGKKVRSELGGYLRLAYERNDFKGDLLKNISFASKLDMFSNYLDKPQNIDINWEVLIGMKINKYLIVNLNTMLRYDDDVKIMQADGRSVAKIQFKEVLGVGFSYNF